MSSVSAIWCGYYFGVLCSIKTIEQSGASQIIDFCMLLQAHHCPQSKFQGWFHNILSLQGSRLALDRNDQLSKSSEGNLIILFLNLTVLWTIWIFLLGRLPPVHMCLRLIDLDHILILYSVLCFYKAGILWRCPLRRLKRLMYFAPTMSSVIFEPWL